MVRFCGTQVALFSPIPHVTGVTRGSCHAQARGPNSCSAVTFDRCKKCTLRRVTIHTASCFGFYESFCTGSIYRHGFPPGPRDTQLMVSCSSSGCLAARHIATCAAMCRDNAIVPYPKSLGEGGQLPLFSTNADGIHSTTCKEGLKVIDSTFRNLGALLLTDASCAIMSRPEGSLRAADLQAIPAL